MSSIIMLGGVLFWSVILIYFIAVIISIENHRGEAQASGPVIFTFVILAILWFTCKDFQTMVKTMDVASFFIGVGTYVVTGLIWSFLRWIKFVRKAFKNATKGGYYNHRIKQGGETAEKAKEELLKEMPLATDNKGEITTWIVFWPFSLLRTVMGNILPNIINYLIDFFSGVYDGISKRAFRV